MLDDLSGEYEQIILGTLLGSGFICGSDRCYLSFQHSLRYRDYFLSKAYTLSKYARKKAIYVHRGIFIWRSRLDGTWKELKDFCYVDGKKVVSTEWLHPLTAIALAIWYCDSGQLIGYKKRNACLRTQSFGLAGNEIIATYFNEMGINCSIRKSKKSYVIVFSVAGTEKFLKIVAPYVHESLHYKITRY
jgi:recombination protein RecA